MFIKIIMSIVSHPDHDDEDNQPSLHYIEPESLATLLHHPGIKIIDVRNDDYTEGHIPTAVNLPHGDHWEDPVYINNIVNSMLHEDKVIFHCMKSQVRGPACARMFQAKLDQLSATKKPEV
jgi:Cdc25 family phosphatase